jgi:hypothetical protein
VLFVSDRVGDVTRIPCNAVPPDRGCRVNPTLKPAFRSATALDTVMEVTQFKCHDQIMTAYMPQNFKIQCLALGAMIIYITIINSIGGKKNQRLLIA